MDEQQVKNLLEKYKNGNCTAEETAWLESWYLAHNEELPHELSHDRIIQTTDRIWDRLNETAVTRQLFPWKRYVAAASVIIAVSAGGYFFLHQKEQPALTAVNIIKPGSNGAILTLANGQKIVLEQAKSGQVAPGVQKANDSLLVYSDNNAVAYNTLETPRGKQYAVVLPDGSKVWLNAASSLKYPTAFNTANRTVELTGEGYFEVRHNSKQPFQVKTANQLIEDIGTHFNVSAYSDEPKTFTTLVEGAVKVNNLYLKPDQQTDGKQITEVNAQQVAAWKDGYFYFDHADVKAVMRQIARWYNVEVAYEGVLPKKQFKGKVYRNVSINQALKILEFFNVHFRIEGKKVIVTA